MGTFGDVMNQARESSRAYERQARGSLRRRYEKAGIPGVPLGDILGGGSGEGGGGTFGSAKNQKRAGQAYGHFRHWVFVAISAIAKRLAGQQFGAGWIEGVKEEGEPASDEGDDGKGKRWRKAVKQDLPRLHNRFTKAVQENQLQVLLNHEVLDALARPNPVQHKWEFVYIYAANLLLCGEAYIVGGWNRKTGRAEMWSIPTPWITPKHEGGLFTSYLLKVSDTSEGEELKPEQVARTYFPDPSDMKGCISPVMTQLTAIRTDDHIQLAQEASFRKGIFPNVAIKVGQRIGEDGKPTGARPVLTGAQRRQIIRAVTQIWDDTVGRDEPAILDGLIEDVYKLDKTGKEMDWINSGESVKKRIFQAFGVNPIVVGEALPSSKAQAVVAERSVCDNAVNPIGDALSVALTDFLQPLYSDPENLQVWLEKAYPLDEEAELAKWTTGLANGAAKSNEYRTEVLGLPPLEEEVERPAVLSTVGGIQGLVTIVSNVGQGMIGPESAKAMLKLVFQVSDDEAANLISDTADIEPPADSGGFGGGQDDDQEATSDDEDEPDEDPAQETPDELEDAGGGKQKPKKAAGTSRRRSASGGKRRRRRILRLSRAGLMEGHIKQAEALEQGVADSLQAFFRTPD